MLQISEFVRSLRSSAWVINNFLLIDATDRSKISSKQKCLFFAGSLYPLSIFANTPFKCHPLSLIMFYILGDYIELPTQKGGNERQFIRFGK